ncbi:MAG: glycosyltransferase [Chloroflexi bacterium]|nr:glycosyltransferase [Chloroflexota bacterium]
MLTDKHSVLSCETILCLAPDPWTGLWRNRHQIMTRLARRNLVLYVEPRVYLWEALRRFRAGKWRLADLRKPLATRYAGPTPLPPLPAREGGVMLPSPGREGVGGEVAGLWLYHDPYYAPFAGRLSGGPLTAGLRCRAMRRTLAALGATGAPILWLLRPYQADQIGQFGEKLVIYHVTDEYGAFPEATDRAAFARAEEATLRRADLVIVTSPGLLASKGRFNPCTYLVPNAVDYEGFQRALAVVGSWKLEVGSWKLETGRSQSPTSNLQSPTSNLHFLGYSGALNEKLDYALLAAVARARPDWQLVLIGQRDLASQPDKDAALRGLPNVHWMGRLPVEQLPAAIGQMDVCLLPYERDERTANIDSLKLYEYLACGRPVVSTDVPAARTFGDPPVQPDERLVRIARDAEEFIAQVAAALADDAPDDGVRRKAVAAANTWEHRVAKIEELLVTALANKP